MCITEILKEILDCAGFYQYGLIDTKDIHFSKDVRAMCEVNTCKQYGKTWACPPPSERSRNVPHAFKNTIRCSCSAANTTSRTRSTTRA